MRTSVILNQKGGVGKSATVINVAAILAHYYGKRVLIVDGDTQGNTTEFFGADPQWGNLAEVLRHGKDGGLFAIASIQSTNFPGIDILASDDSLMDLDLTAVKLGDAQVEVLRDMTAKLAELDKYDYILHDCPPAFNAASAAALVAADDVIIPIKLDAFSLRGMGKILRQITNMRSINPKLHVSGILPTMWYKSDKMAESEQILRSSGLPVFTRIRRSDKVDDMTYEQEPLLEFSPRSAASVDYRLFVAEWMGGADNG